MSDRKSGCLMFNFAALLMFCGLVAAVGGVGVSVWNISKLTKSMQRVVVPGSGKLQLSEPGTHTIFHEYKSEIDGKPHISQAGLADLKCTVTDPSGKDVPLSSVNGSMTYSAKKYSGRAVWTFRASQPGTYTLKGSRPGGAENPKAVLAVMGGFGKALGVAMLWIFGGIGGGIVLGIIGLAFLIVALVRRSSRPKPSPATQDGSP